MSILRNSIGILLGLVIALSIITIAVNIDPNWIEYNDNFVFKHWQKVVRSARPEFFVALLISEGIGSMVGGITTAIIVKEAKAAYAMLIGFILFIVAVFDVFITKGQPTFYEVGIFFVFFPFSWLGGEIVDIIYNKWVKGPTEKS